MITPNIETIDYLVKTRGHPAMHPLPMVDWTAFCRAGQTYLVPAPKPTINLMHLSIFFSSRRQRQSLGNCHIQRKKTKACSKYHPTNRLVHRSCRLPGWLFGESYHTVGDLGRNHCSACCPKQILTMHRRSNPYIII